MPEIVAKLNHFRMSPRKVRLVADMVRGMDVRDAEAHLERSRKRAATPLHKLLRSAIANAGHNFQKEPGRLFIQSLTVDGGPTLKRFRARAFGRAADIHKHTSHITLILGERVGIAKKQRFVLPEKRTLCESHGTLEELSTKASTDKEFTHGAGKREQRASAPKRFIDAGKKFFRRKSV